jgi:hypothetical protein
VVGINNIDLEEVFKSAVLSLDEDTLRTPPSVDVLD